MGGAPGPGRPLRATSGRPSCVAVGDRPLCAPALARQGEDGAGLERTFSTPQPFVATVSLEARVADAAAVEDRVVAALGRPVRVSASSRAVRALGAAPLTAVDGDLGTAWIADAADADPTLTLSWDRPSRISQITLVLDPFVGATRPTSVRLTSPAGDRTVALDGAGHGTFAALRTDRVALHLSAAGLRTSVDPYTLGTSLMGIGVSEVSIPGVTGPVSATTPAAYATPVTFPCGAGPTLEVAGRRVSTSVTATVRALMTNETLAPVPCDGGQVDIAAGEQSVRQRVDRTTAFAVTAVTLDRVGGRTSPEAAAARPEVTATPLTWRATARSVVVGARSSSALLVVAENANDGWLATLGGRPLERVTVDGWQQGYVLPAGGDGVVRLTFEPDRTYEWGLAMGLGAALALLALAALPPHRRRQRPAPAPGGRVVTGIVVGGGVLALAAAGGWVGLLAGALAGAVAVVAHWGRPAVGEQPLTARLVLPASAALTYAAAGTLVLVGRVGEGPDRADTALVQVLALTAVGFAVVSGWLPAPSSSAGPPSAGEPADDGAPRG